MTPEGAVLRQIMDYLAARHVLAFRMQVGAVSAQHEGKKRFMRFGTAGMADVLAFHKRRAGWLSNPAIKGDYRTDIITPTWIEVKAPKGKQSPLQKSFQEMVEREGHLYIVARSIDDLEGI